MKSSLYILTKPLVFALCGLLIACQSSGQEQYDHPEEEVVAINALRSETYQSIEHFGASDAWSAQFVGEWPEQKKHRIAELLFSQENDSEGNPKDRKSTRLNSSHVKISYAVFC